MPPMAAEFEWGSIEWLVNADLVPGAEITVGLVEIAPGMNNPLHFHPNCEEVLHLLEGQLDHRIGDDVLSLTAGSTIHVPRGVLHQATNTGADVARMVVAYPTGHREMVVVEAV
jgi:quercetin dioxygenase-like cupin family protein